ncbi:hypothetical protein RIEGSTA812A_PEG_535 [invertebrate metagenome]|uniref:DUF2497 domain-containing protein n=1 Tax=invertebrate metagenome TaxID=1711999 RepID=A0A484HBA8_9ZZZZ
MTDDRFPQELSVEDMLASIRRILSADEEALQAAPKKKASEQKKQMFGSNEDVLELTNDMLVDVNEKESIASLPLHPRSDTGSSEESEGDEGDERLISPPTAALSAAALSELARVVRERNLTLSHRDITLEVLVQETLRPLLKAWLDEHLSTVVERIVAREIENLVHHTDKGSKQS